MAKAYNKFPEDCPDEGHPEDSNVSYTEPICRICFDVQSSDHALITPCKCTGSVKYIHEDCLKVWLLSKQTDLKTVTCELCMAKYGMRFKFELKFAPCSDCDENIAHWFFMPLLISVFTMLVLIICVITAKIDVVKEEKKFTVVLLVTCALSCLMIMYLFVTSIKEAVFVEEVCEWHILSVTSQDSGLDISTAPLAMNTLPNRNQMITIPRKVRVGSMTVRAPKINSSLLAPVERDGRIVGYTSRIMSPQLSLETL
jgi:hypothetical protein